MKSQPTQPEPDDLSRPERTASIEPSVAQSPSLTVRRIIFAIAKRIWRLPAAGLIFGARFYQVCLSPVLPAVCRYTPTCSSYFIQSVRKYGAVKGSIKGGLRICRCHPWGGSGHDPP